MSDILIKKYYFDCVDERGRAFIGYSARLQWRSLTVPYESYLLSDGASDIDTRASLQSHPFPSITNEAVEWDSPPLRLHGTWRSRCPGMRHDLCSTPQCAIRWDCLQPQSDCLIRVKSNDTLRGRGYAECLELRLSEWRLPFRELRWGRFLSGDVSLVWIDWAGGADRHLVFWNNASLDTCTIDDNRLVMPEQNAILALQCRTVLKASSIVPGALGKIPGLSSVLPRSLVQSQESKWLSSGTLTQPGAPDRHGWAIHEKVVFR
jgi:hypothetical protein